MDIDSLIDGINQKFGAVGGRVRREAGRVPTGLRAEISGIITDLVDNAMRPMLLHYIATPVHLRDGTTVEGQSAFDRMVKEDKDVLALVERYRPSMLWYLRRAQKVKEYLNWDSNRFAGSLADFLEENGVRVDSRGMAYLVRTCDRFKSRIYGP